MNRTELIVHPRFVESAAALQKPQQTRLWKQLDLLVKNPDHPSLHRKIVKGAKERVWEIRLDDAYRLIYEEREDQTAFLLIVANHDDALRFAETWERPGQPTPGVEALRLMLSVPLPLHLDLAKLRETVESYKYERLTQFLKARPHHDVRLTFSEIEDLLGDSLPASARTHRAWWGNNDNRHVQAQAWLSASKRVAKVNLSEGWVVFS